MITRARSVRNVGKVPFKFKFDFTVETVDKLAASGDVVVVWERGSNKSVATKPAKIDKITRKANFNSDKIESEFTLYKTHPADKKFQDKVFKLAVRASGPDGKTLGKIHLNLAEYVEVPVGTKRIGAELTNGSTIIASMQCQFLSMGKQNAKLESSDSDGIEDEAEAKQDLAMLAEDAPANFLRNRLKLGRVGSRKNIGRSEKKSRTDENNSSLANAADIANIEVLKKENTRLRKQIEGLGGGDAKLSEENKSLQQEVQELRTNLTKEPVYVDVVRELKEAKMALALLHLEKEKALFELMCYERAQK